METDIRVVVSKLNAVGDNLPRVVAMGLYKLGLEIIRRAARTVPVDTGRLRASSFVVPPESISNGWRVVLGYGARYAIWVHEGTSRMASRQWLLKVIRGVGQAEALEIIESVVDAAAGSHFKTTPRVASGGISRKPTNGD